MNKIYELARWRWEGSGEPCFVLASPFCVVAHSQSSDLTVVLCRKPSTSSATAICSSNRRQWFHLRIWIKIYHQFESPWWNKILFHWRLSSPLIGFSISPKLVGILYDFMPRIMSMISCEMLNPWVAIFGDLCPTCSVVGAHCRFLCSGKDIWYY